jgi:hypothetical protein
MIEQSRTNLFTYSEQFDNPAWSKTRTTVGVNSITAPDGTLTADKIIENVGTSQDYILDENATSSVATYTYSFFAKAGERKHIRVSRSTGNQTTFIHYYTLEDSGTVTGGGNIESYANGWYRCYGQTEVTSAGNAGFAIRLENSSTNSIYDGDGTSGFYIWGAQYELGSFPTSYIPTSGSTVTRSVDEATITGTNFTDWYNSSEGTIFAKYSAGTYVSEVPFAISKTGDELNQVISIASSSSGAIPGVIPTIVVADSGVGQTGITSSISPVDGDIIKTAIVYKENDFAIASGIGGDVGFASDSSGTIPTVDFARIGKYPYYGIWQNRPIARIMYYPQRLSNAQLQNLTS